MDNYLTITAGLLFSISEILPLVTLIQSNGIIHFFINTGKKFLKNKKIDETTLLLETNIVSETNVPENNPDSDNNYYIKEKEFYEMRYIISYIQNDYTKHFLDIKSLSLCNKNSLLKMNYDVNYDSINDTYKIKW